MGDVSLARRKRFICVKIYCIIIKGWASKINRVLADELSFSNQAIVIIPDISYTNFPTPMSIKTELDSPTQLSTTYTDRIILDKIISILHAVF